MRPCSEKPPHFSPGLPANDAPRAAALLRSVTAEPGGLPACWRALRGAALYELAQSEVEDGNAPAALRLYRRAAATGYPGAQRALAEAHGRGLLGAPRDDARAVLFAHFAAQGGDTQAMSSLAHRHGRGDAVPRTCKTASMYWLAAAEGGARGIEDGTAPVFVPTPMLEEEDLGKGAPDNEEVRAYRCKGLRVTRPA